MEKNKILITMLMHLGLTEKEAAAYIGLLKTEKNTAYDVAKNSPHKKISNTYNLLEKLVEKGAARVRKTASGDKKYFPTPLRDFVEVQQEKVHIVSQNIITLSASILEKKSLEVVTFSGEEEMKKAHTYGLTKKSGGVIECFYPNTPKKVTKKMLESLALEKEVFEKKYKKKIITGRTIHEEYLRNDALFGFERKMLMHPALLDNNLSYGLEIVDEKVLKIFFYKENTCIAVENTETIKSLSLMFKTFWKTL
jgi:sugar-specific transcriptional regulator TrmB